MKSSEKKIYVGSVINYSNREGNHTAIVLHLGIKRSFLLFTTTNPNWNPWARSLTDDEYALLGFPKRHNRPTYFAPVIRHNIFMSPTGKEFPIHRIRALIQEFGSFNKQKFYNGTNKRLK